jgi:hypothetical protein
MTGHMMKIGGIMSKYIIEREITNTAQLTALH